VAELSSFKGGGTITFSWAPDPMIVARDFERAADYLENMTAPLMASRQLGIADVAENFAGEHDPDGNPWAPWSSSYIASGQPGPSILHQEGDLEGSATDPRAWPITAREVFFSFASLPEYGIYHQAGASRISAGRGVTRKKAVQLTKDFLGAGFRPFSGPGASKEYVASTHANPLPARPFAGISEETQFKILDVFDNWFSGALGIAVGASGAVQIRGPGGRFGSKIS